MNLGVGQSDQSSRFSSPILLKCSAGLLCHCFWLIAPLQYAFPKGIRRVRSSQLFYYPRAVNGHPNANRFPNLQEELTKMRTLHLAKSLGEMLEEACFLTFVPIVIMYE
jgi:hypothetical protein